MDVWTLLMRSCPLQVAQVADATPIAYGAFLVFFLVIASATVR